MTGVNPNAPLSTKSCLELTILVAVYRNKLEHPLRQSLIGKSSGYIVWDLKESWINEHSDFRHGKHNSNPKEDFHKKRD